MFSIPGKIDHISTARLDIALGTGHMINFEQWVPSDHKCIINVNLNDIVLYQGPVYKDLIISYDFLDIKDGLYNLKFELEEIDNGFVSSAGWASPMLHIQGIWIEGVDFSMIIGDLGKCSFVDYPDITVPSDYIGNIGTQSFEFTTPIYRWLLSHDNHITKRVKQLSNNYYPNIVL